MSKFTVEDSPYLRSYFGELEKRIGALQARTCKKELLEWVVQFKHASRGDQPELQDVLRVAETQVLDCFNAQQHVWETRVSHCDHSTQQQQHLSLDDACRDFPFVSFAKLADARQVTTRLDHRMLTTVRELEMDADALERCSRRLGEFWDCVVPAEEMKITPNVEARWKAFRKMRKLKEEIQLWQHITS